MTIFHRNQNDSINQTEVDEELQLALELSLQSCDIPRPSDECFNPQSSGFFGSIKDEANSETQNGKHKLDRVSMSYIINAITKHKALIASRLQSIPYTTTPLNDINATKTRVSVSRNVITTILETLFGTEQSRQATPENLNAWCKQGFKIHEKMFWGLTQEQSGPCGVLATVQAYILQCLLFHNGMYGTLEMLQQSEMPEAVLRKLPEIYKNFVKLDHPDYPEEWIHIPALVEALCAILYNATPYSRYKIILFHPLKQNMTNPLYTIIYNTNYEYYELDNIAQVATLLLKHIDLLLADMGVLSFTMSVLATREVENVKNDMDDPEMPLIGLYGHSSQELVNLMLQGKAVSNVFDGEKTLPGADQSVPYRLKGIEAKGNVGFLTEREATRHCQVGSFYKNPRFPVWVLGSYSHYTVLFAVDVNLSKLTEYEIQKDNILNVWACLDPDDNKFITMNLLSTLLEMLGVQRLYSDAKHALTNDSNILLQTTFMDWYLGRTFNNDMELNRPVTLFHYNGQDITRPLVRADLNKLPDDGIQIMYKTSDMKIDQTIDSNILGYAPPEALELAKTLWTRWPKTQVEVNNVEIE